MKNIISVLTLGLAFFYPWISFGLVGIVIIYHIYVYHSVTKKTKNIIITNRNEILNYFDNKLGHFDPMSKYVHLAYISKNSIYFLYPGSSKLFAKILVTATLVLISINIVYYLKFDENSILFFISSLTFVICSAIYSQKFEKPIWDYKNRNMRHISEILRKGLEEYPVFFYEGEWSRIQANKKM